MIRNTSAPPGPVVPVLAYPDVAKAIDWLCGAFGFTERLRTAPEPDGTIHHAQLAVGGGSVILTGRAQGPTECIESVFVPITHVSAHYERAKHFGAKIVREPAGTEFGERQYSAEDLAGRRWVFSQSVADVSPSAWGAKVARLAHPSEFQPRPSFCYVEIPAVDAHQSAAFYEKVFGWNIRHWETDRPSFDDASGHISGAWVTGRPASGTPGLLPYIRVESIEATLANAAAQGGEVMKAPSPDEPGSTSKIATFRDPAGNLIGLYWEPIPA